MTKIDKEILRIGNWISNYVIKNKLNGATIGISGGIDSALLAGIIAKKTNLNMQLAYINIGNSKLDDECVNALEKNLKKPIKRIKLDDVFSDFIKKIDVKSHGSISNIKPRLRMTLLYALAAEQNQVVLGTSNADEFYLGYFTKFGDAGCDLMPLVHLNKAQIFAMAKVLKLPSIIISRAPSACLFEGQTDEKEMGVTYKEIDAYLDGKKISKESKNKIDKMHKNSQHKRSLPLRIK